MRRAMRCARAVISLLTNSTPRRCNQYFRQADKETGLATAQAAVATLKQRGLLDDGDLVIITQGDVMDVIGSTNCLRILAA